jgi:DUSAM domain-containing protein
VEGAEALIREIVTRIRDGERRITQAMFRMTSLRDAGDIEGARQQMREVLAVEVVPLYREMAEENLAGLDEEFPPGS